MLYTLVERMVEHAGVQFTDNLEFHTKTLCDVLFANIRKVIDEKLDDAEFAQWIADKLVEQGAIVKTEDSGGEAKVETVEAVSKEDYQALVDKVQKAIALVQTQKPEILKHIQALDDSARSMSEDSEVRLASEEQLRERRDREITELVGRIRQNQETLQEYVDRRNSQKEELARRIAGFGVVGGTLA